MTGIFNGIQTVISNFRSIIIYIQTIWGFLVNLIKSIGDLIQLCINMFSVISGIILTLPSWLIAFATLTISVCILFLVLGREHG